MNIYLSCNMKFFLFNLNVSVRLLPHFSLSQSFINILIVQMNSFVFSGFKDLFREDFESCLVFE